MERSVAFAAFILAAVCLVLIPSEAAALVRHVAANGVDAAQCGTPAAPCRSISRALEIASDGDTIEVGPGRYGDIDRDLQLASPGDESGEPGCVCLISIGKRVVVRSSAGAPATIISAERVPEMFRDRVRISADGAVFGQPNRGFTLHGSLLIEGNGVAVQGNRFLAPVVVDSTASNAMVTDNVVTGALVSPSRIENNAYVTVDGPNARILRNVFENTQVDVFLGTKALIENNVIVNAVTYALSVDADDVKVSRNVMAGYQSTGLWVPGGVDRRTGVTNNNFIGNTIPAGPNCGLEVNSDAFVKAELNYWGSPTGPGPDPAEGVCLEFSTATADTTPFLTREVSINIMTGR